MKDNNNPSSGSGDTYNIDIHIGYAEHVNPTAKTAISYHYGDSKGGKKTPQQRGEEELDKMELKDKILDYLVPLGDYVADEWLTSYPSLWDTILAIPEVDAVVYNPGKQEHEFNCYLVANIIHLMRNAGVYKKDSSKAYCIALEGTHESSTRGKLALPPDDATIKEKIVKLLER